MTLTDSSYIFFDGILISFEGRQKSLYISWYDFDIIQHHSFIWKLKWAVIFLPNYLENCELPLSNIFSSNSNGCTIPDAWSPKLKRVIRWVKFCLTSSNIKFKCKCPCGKWMLFLHESNNSKCEIRRVSELRKNLLLTLQLYGNFQLLYLMSMIHALYSYHKAW